MDYAIFMDTIQSQKEKKIVIPAIMRMNLKNIIMLHELSQTKKVTYCIIPCIYRINKSIEVEGTLVVSRGWVKEGEGSK